MTSKTTNNAHSIAPERDSPAGEGKTLGDEQIGPHTRSRRVVPNGALGGNATAERRTRERLTALAQLPPLTDPASALDRLDRIGLLCVSGAIPGSQGNAAVHATKVFVDAHRVSITYGRVRELERRIQQLEKENAMLRGARDAI